MGTIVGSFRVACLGFLRILFVVLVDEMSCEAALFGLYLDARRLWLESLRLSLPQLGS